MSRNQLNQKLKLMVDTLRYVIYSNTRKARPKTANTIVSANIQKLYRAAIIAIHNQQTTKLGEDQRQNKDR